MRLLVLVLLMLPAVVQAQFNYTTQNGTVTITGYTGPGGDVSIPDTINGLPVTSIGGRAFIINFSLTSVTIPGSVISIGDQAFNGCVSLESIMIGSGVTSIGEAAFQDCTSLTEIIVDMDNSAYSSVDGVLSNKSRTTLILCPKGKTGNYTIPNSVTSMGDAFSSCTKLTSVAIGSSVTSIEGYAFHSCASLVSVTIPNSVTSIGDSAFIYCTSLTAITVDADNSTYSSVDGVLFDKSQTTLIQCPEGKTGNYTIPSGVTSIGQQAFSRCTSLTSVTIPSSVTSIGGGAFYYCTNLTSISIPDSVTDIGGGSFSSCTSLASVTIPNSVTSIGDWTFEGCTSLTSVTIPSSITTIGGYAFIGCTSLASVTIPDSVTSIGVSAFSGCTSLVSVTIGIGVTSLADGGSLGVGAFQYCTSLNAVYFRGNAPGHDPFEFAGDNDATIYYLPGTTGWGPTFGWRPTALWTPQFQVSDTSFGVRTNQFGFNITWASGLVVVVEACTDLAQPIWSPISTNTLIDGSSYFSDPQWTNYPTRFYRLRSP